jgi:hypothetical protein
MSNRIRGQETHLRVSVDGKLQTGSFFKVKSWKATPRTDIVEDDYTGEPQTDLDIQHHGWTVNFELDELDPKVIDYLTDLTTREEQSLPPAKVTVTVTTTYREPGNRPRIEVFPEMILKVDSRGAGGRKDRVASSFEGRCKTRQVITAPA